MRKLQLAILAASLAGAMSVSASMTVSLVPATSTVAPGSTVDVSVNLSGSEGFTMAAINAIIFYDSAMFTYVDPVVQGGLIIDNGWDLFGAANNPGELRVTGMVWNPPFSSEVAAGAGTLFTFTLLANAGAPLGLSTLSWGDTSGGGGGGVGFCYGDADWNDVVLPSSGVSINVGGELAPVPEPTTIIAGALLLLPFGVSTLRILRKRKTA